MRLYDFIFCSKYIIYVHLSFQVNDELTKSFLSGVVPGHGYFDQKGFSVTQLTVEVSDLHVRDDNTIKLTCMATIPGYIGSLEKYADKRVSTVESKYYRFMK